MRNGAEFPQASPRKTPRGGLRSRPADHDSRGSGGLRRQRLVELLARRGDDWGVETLFEGAGLGRGIAAGELDGRNRTDELAVAGDGTRVVVLARRPGYGLSVLSNPE